MKKTFLATVLGLSLFGSSCLGPNNAFNSILHWNKNVTESKWGNEAIFIGLTIIPVIPLCYWGDILIFNSIEFWGGENPIAPPSASLDGDGRALRIENIAATDGSALRARIVSAAGEEELCTATDVRGVTTLTRSDGMFLATLEPLTSGEVVVRDGLGREVARGSLPAMR